MCSKHYYRWQKNGNPLIVRTQHGLTPAERMWRFVDKDSPGGCWLWTRSKNAYGYGDIQYKGKHLLPHRLAYEQMVGPIPDGFQLDHLCKVRHCVNPAHLQVVTSAENNARSDSPSANNTRKTHCGNGHEFDAENTYITTQGHRCCRACMRQWGADYRARRRQQAG